MVDKIHEQKTGKLNPINFDKIIKSSCCNHGYPVKYTLEECNLIKRYFKGDYKTTNKDKVAGSTNNGGKRDAFPDPKGCLMIFRRPIACESRHRQKLTAREVNAPPLGKVAPAFLKWSKTAITLDGWQECFPLVSPEQ